MKAISFSKKIVKDPYISLALGCPIVLGGELRGRPDADDIVVGWGAKTNTVRARDFAKKYNLRYCSLEDGFIGYVGHPSRDDRRLSVIMDDVGIYYDATRPSRLENDLNDTSWCNDELLRQANCIADRIKRSAISKYNQSCNNAFLNESTDDRARILVVDQTLGDISISLGLASEDSFTQMLEAAQAENPDAEIWVKVHPDVLTGKKKGHFDLAELQQKSIRVIAEDIAPQHLLKQVDSVYVVTSQYGFEALIAGKPVSVFGMPFYAGWGLTDDRQKCRRRKHPISLSVLIAAALIRYPIYVDPFAGKRTNVDAVLDFFEADRALERVCNRRVFALGFSLWKRTFVGKFLPEGTPLRFVGRRALETIKWRYGDAILVWGRHFDEHLGTVPKGVDIWRMEDGFVRSVGLGSDLKRPSSLVLDRSGIYYDGTRPSDLETFLNTHEFSDSERARGRTLIDTIIKRGISKYNVGGGLPPEIINRPKDRVFILVPGQVESDASLAYGSPNIRSNLELLQQVRAVNPDAYILYKPHPDILAKNRDGDHSLDAVYGVADGVIFAANIVSCIEEADEIHTMTSLSGFEALLRGKKVVVYGMPFYAGWGLSEDRLVMPRRGRQLKLEELVFSLLCVYARYVDWSSGKATIAEEVVEAIASQGQYDNYQVTGPLGSVKKILRKSGFLLSSFLR